MDTLKAQQIIANACCILKDSKKHRSKNKTVLNRPKTAFQTYVFDLKPDDGDGFSPQYMKGSKYFSTDEISSENLFSGVDKIARPKTMSVSCKGNRTVCRTRSRYYIGPYHQQEDPFSDIHEASDDARDRVKCKGSVSYPHRRSKVATLIELSDSSQALSSRPQTTHPQLQRSNGFYWPGTTTCKQEKMRIPEEHPGGLRANMPRQNSEIYIRSCSRTNQLPSQLKDCEPSNFLKSSNQKGDNAGSTLAQKFCLGGLMDDLKFEASQHHNNVSYVRPSTQVQHLMNHEEQLMAARRFRKKIIRPGAENNANNYIGIRQPRY